MEIMMTRKYIVEGMKEMYSHYAQSRWQHVQKLMSQVLENQDVIDVNMELPDLDDGDVYVDILAADFCESSRDL